MLLARSWSIHMAAPPPGAPGLSQCDKTSPGPPANSRFISVVVRGAGRGIAVREFTVQPALGVGPVPFGASDRDAQHFRGLRRRQAREIAKGYQLGREGIHSRQAVQS